jgi:peptidoglycan/LPS O-acetylase OafA/YrhL
MRRDAVRPPTLAQALVAAIAPASDYEIVAGDLHEEYLRIASLRGAKAANRWYWAQTVLSIPSLLSYSRSNRSARAHIGVALIAFAVLVAMLAVLMAIELIVQTVFGSANPGPTWFWLCINYADAGVFGAILARLVRTDGLRVAFYTALFLVLCFVIPAVAGHPGSQAPLCAWVELAGVIPAMCIGAAIYQIVRRRTRNVT